MAFRETAVKSSSDGSELQKHETKFDWNLTEKDEGLVSNGRSEKGESEKKMPVACLQHGGPCGYDWLPETKSLSPWHSIPTMEMRAEL